MLLKHAVLLALTRGVGLLNLDDGVVVLWPLSFHSITSLVDFPEQARVRYQGNGTDPLRIAEYLVYRVC